MQLFKRGIRKFSPGPVGLGLNQRYPHNNLGIQPVWLDYKDKLDSSRPSELRWKKKKKEMAAKGEDVQLISIKRKDRKANFSISETTILIEKYEEHNWESRQDVDIMG